LNDIDDENHLDQIDVSADKLVLCRDAISSEGKRSTKAQTIFQQFAEEWQPKVKGRVITKLGRNSPYVDELVQDIFFRAWNWINGSAPIPTPSKLLYVCLDRAFADLMRKLYGRAQAKDLGRKEEEAKKIVSYKRRSGTDPRFPLSLDNEQLELNTLLEQIKDPTNIERDVEIREAFMEAFHSLKPNQRNCLICRWIRKLSVPETQKLLGLSYDQVTKNTADALDKLSEATENVTDEGDE